MFYEKLSAVCELRKTTITRVVKDLGMSTSNVTNWKMGKSPMGATARKLADYLDVSVEFLLSDDHDLHNHPLSDREAELLRVFGALGETDQIRILSQVQILVLLTQENFTEILQIIKQLKDKGISTSEIAEIVERIDRGKPLQTV